SSVAGARASGRLLRPVREVVLVHLAQRAVGDRVPRGVAEYGVDPAPRAERGGVDIGPRLDLGARKYAKAEEARAPSAGLDLGPMPGRMRLRGDKRGDAGSRSCTTWSLGHEDPHLT